MAIWVGAGAAAGLAEVWGGTGALCCSTASPADNQNSAKVSTGYLSNKNLKVGYYSDRNILSKYELDQLIYYLFNKHWQNLNQEHCRGVGRLILLT